MSHSRQHRLQERPPRGESQGELRPRAPLLLGRAGNEGWAPGPWNPVTERKELRRAPALEQEVLLVPRCRWGCRNPGATGEREAQARTPRAIAKDPCQLSCRRCWF